MEKLNIKEYLDSVKNMEFFTVKKQLLEPLPFNGPIPFDIKINKAGVAAFKVLATSKDDALRKVDDWISGLYNDPSEDYL
jgi:hypothetical protein